jgi:ferric-dicitrate binding protein FerR (iron transport regulator)
MNRENDGNELLDLFGALLNGTITAEQQACLDELLLANRAARALYRRYVNLHAALRLCHTVPPTLNLAASQLEQAAAFPVRHEKNRRSRRVLFWASVAAILCVLAGLWGFGIIGRWTAADDRGPAVGTISSMHGRVVLHRAEEEREAEPGMALFAQDKIAVPADASAVLSLAGPTRAELGPETTLAFSGSEERSLYLKKGFLAVEAGQSLRVFTPDARAEVLKTKFILAAAPGQTRLRVAEGSVTLRPTPAGQDVVVPAGFGSGVADGVAMPLSPSRSGEVLLVEALEKSWNPDQWVHFNREMASRLLGEHVRQLALKVAIKKHSDLQASDLEGRPLVIVSVAEEGVGFEDNLRRIGLAEANVPVICLEPIAFPVLGMTGPLRGVDFEWGKEPALVRFPLPGHPLSGQRTGLTKLPVSLGWGRPMGDVLRIATLDKRPDRAVLFAYDTGKQMIGWKAPARRVGLSLDPQIVNKPDVESWSLFEAVVNWCIEPTADRSALSRPAR